jgi:hypothetical protein
MGDRRLAVIHYEPAIAWQARRVVDFERGLERLGFRAVVTSSRQRIGDAPAILFGTTFWQQIEAAPGDWMLVDRASVGDPQYVTLGWNGRGRRGDFKVPADVDDSRWRALGVELQPERESGTASVICGEADGRHPAVQGTHFRPHPVADNPTSLPTVREWIDGTYHVLRSSVAVESLIRGYRTRVYDDSSMAFPCEQESRETWANWIAWTQWNWDEIREGEIGHLFD